MTSISEKTYKQASGVPCYKVSPLYTPDGNVAAHYTAELSKLNMDWETLMADKHFAQVISMDLQAEKTADAPLHNLIAYAPEGYEPLAFRWLAFMNCDLDPWTTGGAIHFRAHWTRVMLLALHLGVKHELCDADLDALCMAAIFHDSRRKDPYLDTGHGARAARYYTQCCFEQAEFTTEAGKNIRFDARTYLTMQWHDRNDKEGELTIKETFRRNTLPSLHIDNLEDTLPAGTLADPILFYRIFKDADGLDRVRLGKGELDIKFLRTEPAKQMVPFAHELLAASQ